jgi:hypothetical protein
LSSSNAAKTAKPTRAFRGIPSGSIFSSLINVTTNLKISKKKIERFVPNTIVIKNPVPDELSKPTDVKLDKNTYVNKNNS